MAPAGDVLTQLPADQLLSECVAKTVQPVHPSLLTPAKVDHGSTEPGIQQGPFGIDEIQQRFSVLTCP